MYAKIFTQFVLSLLTLIVVILVCTTPVSAEQATSSSFMTNNTSVNSLGGSSTSTNFSAIQSADQVGGGQSTSTSFQLAAGDLYYDSFTPVQQKWRWYDDEADETPVTPFAAEEVAPIDVGNSNVIKLRVSVAELAGIGANNIKFKLQFATSSDFSSGALDVVESSDCTGSSQWCYANGAGADNEVITTGVLSDSDACASSVGDGCGTHNESGTSTSSFTQNASTTTEYEFTLKAFGAVTNTVYFFRLFDNAAGIPVPLNTGASYPSLSTEGTSLSFTIEGIAASTVTSGTTTTIDTTPESVPFGSMLISTSNVGAQRLTVSTDASQGYEVFSYAQQDLLGSGNAEIPPVSATNASPLGWTSACITSASGCYGYHTNEAVLAGGSTRFAADDTYAQFSTTSPSEVAFSPGATTTKSTDIVYKVEVHDQQTADSYSTNVVYIVVPTF